MDFLRVMRVVVSLVDGWRESGISRQVRVVGAPGAMLGLTVLVGEVVPVGIDATDGEAIGCGVQG
jgi:hypothetical protein